MWFCQKTPQHGKNCSGLKLYMQLEREMWLQSFSHFLEEGFSTMIRRVGLHSERLETAIRGQEPERNVPDRSNSHL
jgi:hypothetical protein